MEGEKQANGEGSGSASLLEREEGEKRGSKGGSDVESGGEGEAYGGRQRRYIGSDKYRYL